MGLYLLELLEGRKLNQVDVQEITKKTNTLVNEVSVSRLKEASTILQNTGCTHTEAIAPMIETLTSQFAPDLFHHLRNTYQQQKFFEDKFNLINPKVIILPESEEYFGRVQTGKPQAQKEQSYIVVSLLDQLELLLQRDDVYAQVMQNKVEVEGVLSRFEDGTAFKTSELFKRYPKAIQIHLYLDEAQVCDPLGSKTTSNKLVFVYFQLGNIDVKFRSNLKSIFLLSIFYNHQVHAYVLNLLLKPIVDELKQLEIGYNFKIGGRVKMMFGTVTIFTADNLAAHQVAGFKIGFAKAFRKCRYCLATDCDIQSHFSDCLLEYRTKENHILHCQRLNTNYAEHFQKLYGINFDSVLNELQYFHVIGGMVPDVLHDVLEGVLPRTTCLMLRSFLIEKKYFSIDQLNHALRNFPYGHSDIKNKPSLIDIAHIKRLKLRQSASQLWQLSVTLPLAIGSLVPYDDEEWLCFTIFLEICRYIFKPAISLVEICQLEFLIEEFLTAYKRCYPEGRILPKYHFLLHYPREFRRLGPLIQYWCMRYESKHSYFKQLVRSIGNWINLPLTLGKRHQQMMCLSFAESSGTNFLKFNVVCPPRKKCFLPIDALPFYGQIADVLRIEASDTMIKRIVWIKIGSQCYKVNKSLVLCPLNGYIKAAFGNITSILVHDDNHKVAFVVDLYHTVEFNEHFQAFRLKPRKDKLQLVIPYTSLLDHKVYHFHSPMDLCITPRVSDARSLYVIAKTNIQKLVLNKV